MSEHRVASRYAKSLIDLAIEKNIVDAVLADMNTFLAVAHNNSDFASMLKSPVIGGDKKNAVITGIFSKYCQVLTMDFFKIIIRKGREKYLEAIAKNYIEQYNKLNNIIKASIKTAVPVGEQLLNEVKQFLEAQTGKKVQLSSTVDAKLIGGIMVMVEDKLFDATIAGKLDKLKHELINSYISK
ncbi:MAG: ATP synthase F1 subunit delta [Bacteroidia bacterium]|jgi:F-type H+-transporting ATPase subunit delta|nr:ATP synthase F1 subunit delta [Bacteroidia bacterium]